MRYVLLLLSLLAVAGCVDKSKIEEKINAVPMTIDLVRFDQIFATTTLENIPVLKKEYPMFFPKQYHDSIWEQRVKDTFQIELNKAVSETFPNNDELDPQLTELFKHIKYYFPQFKKPRVFTTTSDVDYKNKVLLSDSLLIVALDTYLGADHRFYEGVPNYVRKNMKKSRLAPDVATVYSQQLVSRPRTRTLLAQMIYFGKELYLKDQWLPSATDGEKIGFTKDELIWAQENEVDIWRYFVENEILFSTDVKLLPRFINPAPFSKFYLEIDNESPGMIGRYIGWQMVRSYMDNNAAVTINQLMISDAEEIFNNSKYKPKK